jgi:predicted phage terminase large subunit-like protein
MGAGSSSCTGLHVDLIILDDVTDFDIARSSVQSERLEIWFKTALLPVLEPGGRVVSLGTRYAMGDFYKTLIDMNYNVKIFPAIKDGKALIPWIRPLDDEMREGSLTIGLNSMKKDMGSLLFDLQMMNDTSLLADNNVIKGEWIQYYEIQPDPMKEIMISVDPAIGLKSENDYTAIGVWCKDNDNNIYLLESINKRITFNKTITSIGSLINRWNPERVLVEDVAYQKAIIQELKRVYPNTVTLGVKVIGDKRARLINVSSVFENGKVYFRKRETELVDQILYFPSSNDDLVDMMTHAIGYYKEHENSGVIIF